MTPQPKGLRERKKQEKLARIKQAARELFSKQGYEKTTTRQIADRAGIGVGTLFVYFPTKRDLLFEMFRSEVRGVNEAAFADLEAELVGAPETGLVDRLIFVLERFFDYYERDKDMSRVFIKELGFVTERDRAAMNSLANELVASLADLIGEAQRTGQVDPGVVPFVAAYTVFCLYSASLIGWLGGTVPVREMQVGMLRGALELMYRGLAVRPA